MKQEYDENLITEYAPKYHTYGRHISKIVINGKTYYGWARICQSFYKELENITDLSARLIQ